MGLVVTGGMCGCLTAVLISLMAALTHAKVGHAAVSQDHDEFGLIRPPLLLSCCIEVLHRIKRKEDAKSKNRKSELRIVNILAFCYAIGICSTTMPSDSTTLKLLAWAQKVLFIDEMRPFKCYPDKI